MSLSEEDAPAVAEDEMDLGSIVIRMVLRADGEQVVRTHVAGPLPAVNVFGMLEFAKMYVYDSMNGGDEDDEEDDD